MFIIIARYGFIENFGIISGPSLTDFDCFLQIMAKRMTVPEQDDQLIHAFRVFDKEGKNSALKRCCSKCSITACGLWYFRK